LAAEESVLRTSLRPGLLKAIAYNESHRTERAALFEIGKVFGPPSGDETLPDEREHLALVLAGEDARAAVAVWDVVAHTLGLPDPRVEQDVVPDGLHPARSGVVRASGTVVGEIGEVDPGVLDVLEIRERVAWLQLDLDLLLALPHGEHTYRRISRFPSSDLDLAFEVDDDVAARAVADAISAAAGELLVRLGLFDVFRGAPVPEGRRSLAFRLRFQAPDRTLTDDELTELRRTVVAAVESDTGATLRA
jgi:phenylalanyl-tRNA synthetase beta chain